MAVDGIGGEVHLVAASDVDHGDRGLPDGDIASVLVAPAAAEDQALAVRGNYGS